MTLQGSNSTTEVNNLGGFTPQSKMVHSGTVPPTTNGFKYPPPSAFDMGYDYMKGSGTNGTNGYYANGSGHDFNNNHGLITTVKPVAMDYLFDDDLTDVFSGLSFKEPFTATPGFGRGARPQRRSSAPVTDLWSDMYDNDMGIGGSGVGGGGIGGSNLGRAFSSNALSSNGWNGMGNHLVLESNQSAVSSIWGSRPDSQLSSYSGSDQGISPVYSPVSNGPFDHIAPAVTTSASSYTIPPVTSSLDTEARNSHKVSLFES